MMTTNGIKMKAELMGYAIGQEIKNAIKQEAIFNIKLSPSEVLVYAIKELYGHKVEAWKLVRLIEKSPFSQGDEI